MSAFNFRTVLENEYQSTIIVNYHLVNCLHPKMIIKFCRRLVQFGKPEHKCSNAVCFENACFFLFLEFFKYTGTATATLVMYAASVDSYAVVKCMAKDTDSTSNTYNSKFFDVATFIDNSDPIQVIVTSTGGDVFKNGHGR